MNDRKQLLHPVAVLAMMVPVGFGLALVDLRSDDRLQVAQVSAPEAPPRAVVEASPKPTWRPRPPAPLPVEGEVEQVAVEGGLVMNMQRLPEGYVHEPDNLGDQSMDALEEPPELPPNRRPVNPKALGFDSMWDLEQHLRARYGIDSDKPVEIWMEQRGSKLGVAIDVNNPEPEPADEAN